MPRVEFGACAKRPLENVLGSVRLVSEHPAGSLGKENDGEKSE